MTTTTRTPPSSPVRKAPRPSQVSRNSTSGVSTLSDYSPLVYDGHEGHDSVTTPKKFVKRISLSAEDALKSVGSPKWPQRNKRRKSRSVRDSELDRKEDPLGSTETVKMLCATKRCSIVIGRPLVSPRSDYESYDEDDAKGHGGIFFGIHKAGFKESLDSLNHNNAAAFRGDADLKPVSKMGKDVNFKKDILKINVCGQEHYLSAELVERFPNTLLGSTAKDPYYRNDLQAYYFDRSRHAFDAVMGYYLSGGVFMFPAKLNREVVQREMHFYKIPVFEPADPAQDPENEKMLTFRQKLYRLLNYPKSSRPAAFLSALDCILILIAVMLLVLETEPNIKPYFEDENSPYYKYLFGLNSVIMIYFTIDYFARMFAHPSLWKFLGMLLPWMDLLSILPFYVEIVMMLIPYDESKKNSAVEDGQSRQSSIVLLRICRIFRVLRVFKFARRSENLLILLKAVGNTYRELILLSGVVSLAVISFGSVMYTIDSFTLKECTECSSETDKKGKIDSILTACWWAVITVTTVGYGDIVPSTTIGKCFGSIAVFCGLIIIALPATIIVTRFSEEYEKSKMANDGSGIK